MNPKWQLQNQANNDQNNRIHTHIYTCKYNQNSPTKIKYSRLTRRTKETKSFMYQLRTKLSKAQTEK